MKPVKGVIVEDDETTDEIMLAVRHIPDLIPYRHFTIETSWPVDAAVREIQERVISSRQFGIGANLFFGRKTSDRSFQLHVPPMRDARRATILLRVDPGRRNGARIDVRMRPTVLVALFFTVWLTGMTAFALAAVRSVVGGNWSRLLPLILPALGIAFVAIPFMSEARRAERILREIFRDAPALPEPPDTGKAYR